MKKSIFTFILSFALLFSCGGNPSSSISGNTNSEISSNDSSIDLSTLQKAYHNYNSYDNLEVVIENLPKIYTLEIEDELIKSDDYKILEEGNLIIRNSILKKYEYGNYLLSINNKINFNLVIYDDRTPSLIGNDTVKITLNKDPKYKFVFYDGIVTSVIHNEEELIQYIKIEKDELIILPTIIEKLGEGTKVYNVHIDQDTPEGIKRTTIDIKTYYPKSTGDTIII